MQKHIEHLYPKLGVKIRTGAAIWYLNRRIKELERENARLKRHLRLGEKKP